MPAGVVKTDKEEKIWGQKKKEVEEQTGKKSSSFTDKEWARVNFLFQRAKKKYKGKGLPVKYKTAAFFDKVADAYKVVIADDSDRAETVVTNMMRDKRFTSAIEDMIDAANAAVNYAHAHQNEHMLTFNTLCLAFFHAIKNGDKEAAIEEAKKLMKAGHGKAFGLA